MDRVSQAHRSVIMRSVRSKDTGPELIVRGLLHRMGFRFRLHVKCLPGRPDVVLPKWRTVVFVHGCFWHRHRNCPRTTYPADNREFWKTKFDENVRRDQRNKSALTRLGWSWIVVWECETTDIERLKRRLTQRLCPAHSGFCSF